MTGLPMPSQTPAPVCPSAHVNGVRIRYARAGEGPPLGLLHGFAQSPRGRRHVIPRFAGDYTAIAPDLRT